MHPSIDVKIKDIDPMTVPFIKVKGDFSQIPLTFQKLCGWIAQKGYKPVGPSIAVYYNIPGEVPNEQLDWELGSQLSGDIAEAGLDTEGLGVKRVEAVKVASTMYEGPYEDVGPVYIALNNWVAASNYEVSGPPQELYYNDPTVEGTVPITEIRLLVREK
ncbi:GyrI-like domain-containing protein [Chloroflexota bacterium]